MTLRRRILAVLEGRLSREVRKSNVRTTARYAGALSAFAFGFLAISSVALALTPVGVRTSALTELEPAAAPGYFAWSQNSNAHPHHFNSFVKPDGAPRLRVNPHHTGSSIYGGAIDGTTLVFAQWRRGEPNGDLRFFDLLTHKRSAPSGVNTRKSEEGASLSGDWLLFRRGARSSITERIILRNLLTHEQRVLDVAVDPYAQPGNVAGNYAVWFRCPRETRCSTYLYDIGAETATKLSNPNRRAQYAPAVTADGTVYLVEAGNAICQDVRSRIFRYGLGQPRELVLTMPHNRDPAIMSALDNGGGSTTLYFDRYNCRRFTSDIYKVDLP
jgi:hypothetical protein